MLLTEFILNDYRSSLARSLQYATFASGDPKHITPLEFARHRAWRARGLLQHIIDDVPFPDPKDEKEMSDHKCYLVNTLGKVAAELEQTRRILAGTESDAIGFYDEVAKRKEMTAAKVVSSPEKQ